jgi:DNA-binding beta-propeller fold protein YncE
MKFKIAFLLLIIFTACDESPVNITGYNFSDSAGVYIVNEGNYMQDNATLSFLNLESMKVYNNVFFSANETRLGDVAYSMVISGNTGYIVINNSGRIYSIDIRNARFCGKLTGFTSPRNIYLLNDKKGYVTDLYSMKISIFNPSTYEVTGEIDVCNNNPFNQHSTEQMAGYGNYIFIGCWSYDNKILVLDTTTDRIIDSITVTKQPNSLVIDKNNKLWVLSDGGFPGSAYGQETAALSRIDAETRNIELVMQFPSLDDSPIDLVLNGSGDTLYFILHGIRRMSVTNKELPADAFIKNRNNDFYSIAVDPETSVIYAGDPIDYQQNGLVYRFSPDGELIDSLGTGINPGAFCFKY